MWCEGLAHVVLMLSTNGAER